MASSTPWAIRLRHSPRPLPLSPSPPPLSLSLSACAGRGCFATGMTLCGWEARPTGVRCRSLSARRQAPLRPAPCALRPASCALRPAPCPSLSALTCACACAQGVGLEAALAMAQKELDHYRVNLRDQWWGH